MKRIATARKPPSVVPLVVVAVNVHVALVIPAIEGGLYGGSSIPLPLEYSRGCIVFGILNAITLHTKYLLFFEVSACTTLPETVAADTPDAWILGSVAGDHRLPHGHLLPLIILAHKKPRTKSTGPRTKGQGSKRSDTQSPEYYLRQPANHQAPPHSPPLRSTSTPRSSSKRSKAA